MLFEPFCLVKFCLWCLLRFLLKTVSDNYKVVLVKEAENAINVATNLNSNFIKSFCVLQMLKIDFRNSVQRLYNLKCPKNFLLNLPSQAVVEVPEIILVEKKFTFFVHQAKLE